METLKVKILSWLLHRANRENCDEYFYKIKNKILSKWGIHIGYDVQFIEGRKCNSCYGTGRFQYFDYGSREWEKEDCFKCYNGWYKRPVWNILSRVQFGKYVFHQPFERAYVKPEISNNIIEGYIEHNKAKWGATCYFILHLFYEKGYVKRWYSNTGNGWRCYWYFPRNWIPCIIHIIKNGRKSYPVRLFVDRVSGKYKKLLYIKNDYVSDNEDLPF